MKGLTVIGTSSALAMRCRSAAVTKIGAARSLTARIALRRRHSADGTDESLTATTIRPHFSRCQNSNPVGQNESIDSKYSAFLILRLRQRWK